ncbi:MAG TPA: HupE/UreJ family protein [Burkholderiaceae bacterium]
MKCVHRRTAFALGLASCAPLAHAHLISTGLGPFYDGITHFALTPGDLLAMLAAAVLAALRGNDQARRAVFVLPLAWLAGGIVAVFAGVVVPDVLAWAPLLLLGGLVAADLRLSPATTTAIVLVVGTMLGVANGGAMMLAGAGLRGIAGSAAAVFVLATLVAAAASAWHAGWLRIAWRVAGSWIAAGGLLLLGWSLR